MQPRLQVDVGHAVLGGDAPHDRLVDPLELVEVAAVVEVVEIPDDLDTVDGAEEIADVAVELLPQAAPTSANPTSAGR